MPEEEHRIKHCNPYGEEVLDGVCQNPRAHSLICSSCSYNKRLEKATEEVEVPVGEEPTAEETAEEIEAAQTAAESERETEEGPPEEEYEEDWEEDIENIENQMKAQGYSQKAIEGVRKVYS